MNEKIKKIQQEFIDDILRSLENNTLPWRMPWEKTTKMPYNGKTIKRYQGFNLLKLIMASRKYHYDDPRWMTYKQANEAGFKIKAGSVGIPIIHYSIYDTETKKYITTKEYLELTEEEQKKCRPSVRTYTVFNANQIHGIPALESKEKYVAFNNELAERFTETMIENMDLKVLHQGNEAYYSPREDMVCVPNKNQFMDEQSYYATLLHESAHATSHPTRLDREIDAHFGTKDYALEELRAEITSSFLTMDIGFHFDAFHDNNHKAYIKHWYDRIKENPKVIFDAIKDAQKIHDYMIEKGELEKILNESIEVTKEDAIVKEKETALTMERDTLETEQTVVINMFAGPGAGKTTCAWEVASKLKKMHYTVEYVSEYAKEFVWEENIEMLDGSLEHQKLLLNEQMRRLDRLQGKVDFVVTDAPILMNMDYLKCDDLEQERVYKDEVLFHFKKYTNFNLFVNRGEYFETEGRIHDLEAAKQLDAAIKETLIKNHIYYQEYDHKNIDRAILDCTKMAEHQKQLLHEQKVDINDMKNAVSIAEYARDILGMNLIKESRGILRLEEHDSCKIYPNNTFYRFSTGVGGSVIDFIKHFEGCDTKDAIERMKNYYMEYHPTIQFDTLSKTFKSNYANNVEGITLPEKANTNKHVFAYLTKKRYIKPSIVNEYFKRNILYEDVNQNCVFVGKLDKTVYYANMRGTGKRAFKGDVASSIKEVGIYIDNHADTLVVNEAAIDQMSYMSMCEDPHRHNYLSVNGATNTIPALRFHMEKREEAKNLKKIIIGLDNDKAGEENTLKTVEFMKQNYPDMEVMVHIPEAKDFNEQLSNEMNLLAEVCPSSSYNLSMG